MKVLRVILLVLAAVIAIVVIMTLSSDPNYDISRSIEIDASAEAVWPHVASLEKADAWSPWMKVDESTVKEYMGTQGTLGSATHWTSNHEEVGEGKQTVTKLEPYSLVETELLFIAPYESKSTGYTKLSEKDGKTTVTWGFSGVNEGFMTRMMMSVLMNMDEMIGPKFNEGLSSLKSIVESEEAGTGQVEEKSYRGYSISRINREQVVFIGKRKVVGWDQIAGFFGSVLPAAGQAAAEQKYNIDGMPCGVYFSWNEEDKTTDMFAAMPIVAEPSVEVGGFETLTIPAGKALMIDYYGAYDKSDKAHYAMDDMMKDNGIEEPEFVIEQYMNDPATVDTSEWHTRIYYMIS